MESSTPTEQIDSGSVDGAREPGWADTPSARGRPTMTVSIREQCSACGAGMASDQRYCVECGQRRGPARVPLLDGTAHRAGEPAPVASRPVRRPSMSVNSTLIAIIGTLLLAMGVGVLIGRSSNNVKSLPAQVVTVAGGGGTASTATTTAAPQSSSASAAPKSSGASTTSHAKSATKTPAAAAPAKTVTVGSPGKGAGYQHGHFTGNFFGPEAE
jgi:hypothetical protein